MGIVARTVEDFTALPGRGVTAREGASVVAAGNAALMEELGIEVPTEQLEQFARAGKTPLFFARNGQLAGTIAVADEVKPTSAAAIRALEGLGIKTVMLTGDNALTAGAIARSVGVSDVVADVMPADKERHVRALQDEGRSVAMVGDGINDSPALARADVGLAIGTGADIAKEGADVVLMRSDLMDVARAIELSRAVIRNIKQDLFWALFYNACGIPLAAGGVLPASGLAALTHVRRGSHEPLEPLRLRERASPTRVQAERDRPHRANRETLGSAAARIAVSNGGWQLVREKPVARDASSGYLRFTFGNIFLREGRYRPDRGTFSQVADTRSARISAVTKTKFPKVERTIHRRVVLKRKDVTMQYIIKTEGLHCGHCDASVETELMKVAGVTDADADHETNTVQVETEGEVAAKALAGAVVAAGFKALSVEAA